MSINKLHLIIDNNSWEASTIKVKWKRKLEGSNLIKWIEILWAKQFLKWPQSFPFRSVFCYVFVHFSFLEWMQERNKKKSTYTVRFVNTLVLKFFPSIQIFIIGANQHHHSIDFMWWCCQKSDRDERNEKFSKLLFRSQNLGWTRELNWIELFEQYESINTYNEKANC